MRLKLIVVSALALGLFSVFRQAKVTAVTPSRSGAEQSEAKSIPIETGMMKTASVQPANTLPEPSNPVKVMQPATAVSSEWTSVNPAAHRSNAVEPDIGFMTKDPSVKVGDVVQLALFDDVELQARIKQVEKNATGAVGMTATLEGSYGGVVYLSYSGMQMRISAEVAGGNDFYVRYDAASGNHIAIEVDKESTEHLGCAICEQADVQNDLPVGDALRTGSVALSDGPEDTVTVDWLVVYTPAAKNNEGGIDGINNNISMALQKANEVHGNSDTKLVVNLVHAEEVSYVENQGDMGEDLEKLTFTGEADSEMDNVQVLRDTYGADFVSLFAMSTNSGGIGWLLNNQAGRPDYAFNVNRVQQTDFSYTVVHELGHNMGCGHSATQYTQQGPGLYSYSSGWQWSDASVKDATIGYCSVMTYENHDNNGANGFEYERVAHFSNPSITYFGNATGDAVNGDNARTIRNVRHVVGDYRVSVVLDTDLDGIPDGWETFFYGSVTGAVAGVDTDGDGADNYSEYIAGTDPTNAVSVFAVTDFEVIPSEAGRVIIWNAVENRVYNVLWSDNLVYTSFTNHNISGDLPYPANSYTDTVNHAADQNFYRVDVKLTQ